MERIYLDHAATTPVRPEVREAMEPYLSQFFGNASSVHTFGQEAKKALEDARCEIARCIGAEPDEIYLTSGGTESDNLAVKGIMRAHARRGKHVITSAIEHQAVLNCARYLRDEGCRVTFLPVDGRGVVELDPLQSAIGPDTVLISVMLANNETGVLQPLKEICGIARQHGVPVHTDAVQALGKVPVSVDEMGVDLLSLSGHKVHGPKGVGALYVRRGIKLEPILHGGHHERHLRPGTENVAAAVGLARAVELAGTELQEASARIRRLRDRLERRLRDCIAYVRLNGHPERRLPNVLNMSFAYVEGESLLPALDTEGIAVSTGSACTSGSLEPSHVLLAMNVPPGLARGSLRFSLGRDNTPEEIEWTVEVVVRTVERLRRLAPVSPCASGECNCG